MPEDTSQDERTESASPRKREEARQKGQVAQSTELVSAFMFLIGLSALRILFPSMYSQMKNLMENIFTNINPANLNPEDIWHYGFSSIITFGKILAPFSLVMVISALLINYAQIGFHISTEALKIDLNRMNPITGFKRFVSKKMIVTLVQSLLKVLIVAYVLYITVNGEKEKVLSLADMQITTAVSEVVRLVFKMGFRTALLLLIIASFDYAYQRWEYERSLKMTKQEVKEEMKSSEGDPMVKSRIRSIQREMAMKRMMQEVPKADVVITNPTHLAVALKYKKDEDQAPKICAKGRNLIAEKIKEIARKHEIPIIEDKPLAQSLFKLDVGHEIPTTLYKAVAEILARIYKSNRSV
jgi:flagellar biosynthetic protein FlhB